MLSRHTNRSEPGQPTPDEVIDEEVIDEEVIDKDCAPTPLGYHRHDADGAGWYLLRDFFFDALDEMLALGTRG